MGTVSIVNTKDLKSVPASNLGQQLEGRPAGVQFGNEGSPDGNVMVDTRLSNKLRFKIRSCVWSVIRLRHLIPFIINLNN